MPNRETVNLATEVRALFDYYDAVAEEKELHLTLEGNGEVNADKLMLRRALGNLLSNAVRNSTAKTTLRVNIGTDPNVIAITMENTGDTIPQDYLERVFDRFFRVDFSRQRSSEGAGLGLAITKLTCIFHATATVWPDDVNWMTRGVKEGFVRPLHDLHDLHDAIGAV